MPSKRTQNSFTTTRQISDVLFILLYELDKIVKYWNIETTTKFSRLEGISGIEDNYSFTLVIFFLVSLYNYKGKLSSFIVKKKSIEIGFKEVCEFLKGFFDLFVFGSLFTIIKKNYDIFYLF